MKSKGIALVLVLGFIMVAVLAANIALRLITGHSLLTQHKVGRIQAFYAAQAGINYALEMLRVGPPSGWAIDLVNHKHYCINDDFTTMTCTDGNFNDTELLPCRVEIDIFPQGTGGIPGTTQLEAKVEY